MITSNSEYHLALASIEKFIERGFSQLTKAETAELKKLSLEVEDYEQKKYPMPLQFNIIEMLEGYMFENRINRKELSKLLEVSNSALSEILNGKRPLNLTIAKKLHQKLNIDGNLLLENV